MKKVLFIMVPLILIAGVGITLILTGAVKTPLADSILKKKKPPVASLAPETKSAGTTPRTKHEDAPPQPRKKPSGIPTVDPNEGARALAATWNEVETPKLVAILKTWNDPDIARILVEMEPAKVAEILGTLAPDRASKLSKMVEKQASIIKPAA